MIPWLQMRTSQFLGSQLDVNALDDQDHDSVSAHDPVASRGSSQYWQDELQEDDFRNISEFDTNAKPIEARQGASSGCLRRASLQSDEFDLMHEPIDGDLLTEPDEPIVPQTPTKSWVTSTGTQPEDDVASYKSPLMKGVLARHESPCTPKATAPAPAVSPSRRPGSRGQKPSANTSFASTATAISASSSVSQSPSKPSFMSKLTSVLPSFKLSSPPNKTLSPSNSVGTGTKRARAAMLEVPTIETQSKRSRSSTSSTSSRPQPASLTIAAEERPLKPPSPLNPSRSRGCGRRTLPSGIVFGFNQEIHIAGHPDFNDLPIGWGTKWEVQRHEKDHHWQLPPNTLVRLEGPQVDIIPKVAQLVRGLGSSSDVNPLPPISARFTERENSIRNPCKEMDREDAAWDAGNDEGLGLICPDGWFGGKIRYSAVLDFKDGKWKTKLETPVLGPSTHFTRAFTSKSLIILRLTDGALKHHNIKKVLQSRFMVFGRGFRTLDAEADKVFLVDDGIRRPGYDTSTDDPAAHGTLHYMTGYLNPLQLNQNQSLVKWRSRFHLYFSTSVPGFRTTRDRIRLISDIELPHIGKCPSDKILTDGCGGVRVAVIKEIQHQARWEPVSALQVRVFGSKGMLLAVMPGDEPIGDLASMSTHPQLHDPLADIFLRNSQVKIRMDPQYENDLAKLTIDVIRPAQLTMPSRLSWEAIQILSWNGVPTSVFENLQINTFQEDFGPLVDWGDGPMLSTAKCVEVRGRIITARRVRLSGGAARARGLSYRDTGEVDEGADDDERQSDERSTPWWPDYLSGCPSSLEETVATLLFAGFRPESMPTLRKKLQRFLESALARAANDFKINVPRSLSAIIVPDPLGILQPDQVSICLSQFHIDETNNRRVHVLEGSCTILRNPAKQETDIRKVMMVNCPELHDYRDVIVMPITDTERSLASRLSGGDYDGGVRGFIHGKTQSE
ncbi:hypothetical protein FRB94_005760 [Tulasnella sp. JGI-2019a]|nr:hypothetical protein FRB93_001200 [Tulasnella sp. JGI-2019a]KAG8999915.1 hypothetical protein FRB94_005760 [Tulasnella sp. JGI-2019a]